MSDKLQQQVKRFHMLQLPGQPQMMHVGTTNLVRDLWNEVQRLRRQLSTVVEDILNED